jgi:3-oxoadipate enol-lactonase
MFAFIHGSGCTGRVFAAQTAAFADSIALTLPGHADGFAGPASIEAFTLAVEAEIERRDVRDVIACGSSMGGAIALELAIRNRLPLAGVVLLGSGAKLRVAPALFEQLENDFPRAASTLASLFFANPTPELIHGAVEEMRAVGQAQTLRDFRACDAFDATQRLAGVRAPLLALTGELDALTPPKFAQFLADRIPGATARILPEAGHLAMVERPEAVNDALRAFAQHL